MLSNRTSNIIKNIIVLVVSCLVFLVFFTNLYQNAHTEHMYEITDHTIPKKAILNDDYKNDIPNNTEQTDYKVFALVK